MSCTCKDNNEPPLYAEFGTRVQTVEYNTSVSDYRKRRFGVSTYAYIPV